MFSKKLSTILLSIFYPFLLLCHSIDLLMTYSENDIVTLIKKGDKQAFEVLFNEFFARLCEYSKMICKDEEMAMEIVQDFFVKLWENHSSLNIKSLKSYLFRAVHNNTIKHLEKKAIFTPLQTDQEYGTVVQFDFEMSEVIEKSLDELPPKCREIFILSRVDRLRHNEIAEKMGISPRTVEVQVRKASKILQRKMKGYYNSG